MVIRDGEGRVIHTARLDSLESDERFGYDQCRYWHKPNLEEDFAGKEEKGTDLFFSQESGSKKNKSVPFLKDNPLQPGELERLETLLPGCKIKV